MKKSMYYALFFLILSTGGCSNNSSNNSNTITPSSVSGVVASGSWRVTYYWDTDHEETSNFSNYQFVFANNNLVTATNAGNTVSGSWSTGLDDSKTKLVLDFVSPADFEEISDDWEVVEQTASKIRLQDVSGGNGGTDYLTFEKI